MIRVKMEKNTRQAKYILLFHLQMVYKEHMSPEVPLVLMEIHKVLPAKFRVLLMMMEPFQEIMYQPLGEQQLLKKQIKLWTMKKKEELINQHI
jgi:hypothetical protein